MHILFPKREHTHIPHAFSHGTLVVLMSLLILFCGAYFAQRVTLHAQLGAIIASTLFTETNSARVHNHLQTLTYDETLASIAQEKAQDMVAHSYFAHTSPSGKTPWYWLEKNGYQYSYAGENLAAHFSESTDVISAWKASPAHYENLVNESFTHVGFGVAEGELNGAPTTFVVQLFATPAPQQSFIEPADILPAPLVAQAGTNISPIVETSAPTITETTQKDLAPSAADVVDSPPLPNNEFIKNDTPVPVILEASINDNRFINLYIARNALVVFLSLLLTFFAFIYFGNWIIHGTIPHVHVSKGFASIAACTIGLLCLVYGLSETPLLPTDTQSASVILVL